MIEKENFELEKRVEKLEKAEKLFADIEERLKRGEEFTEEDVSFLFSETKDIARREALVKMNARNTNKRALYEKYADFLFECNYNFQELEDIIVKGTIPIRITEEEFVIEVTKANVTDEIEDFIYKEVMDRYDGQKVFKIEGDIWNISKKNKYRKIGRNKKA